MPQLARSSLLDGFSFSVGINENCAIVDCVGHPCCWVGYLLSILLEEDRRLSDNRTIGHVEWNIGWTVRRTVDLMLSQTFVL
jgi:hypothetical protein